MASGEPIRSTLKHPFVDLALSVTQNTEDMDNVNSMGLEGSANQAEIV